MKPDLPRALSARTTNRRPDWGLLAKPGIDPSPRQPPALVVTMVRLLRAPDEAGRFGSVLNLSPTHLTDLLTTMRFQPALYVMHGASPDVRVMHGASPEHGSKVGREGPVQVGADRFIGPSSRTPLSHSIGLWKMCRRYLSS